MSKAKASNQSFSAEEAAFFEEGDTLADSQPAFEDFDFSDLEPAKERSATWAERAMAVLALVAPARTQS